jgi:hypothetical protein
VASPKGKKGRRATHEEIPLVRRFIKADESMPVPVWRAVMYVTACQRGPVSQMIGPSFPSIESYMRDCGVRDRRNARRFLDEAAETKWVQRVDPGDGNAWHWYTLVPPEIESQIKAGDVPPDGYPEDDPRSRKKSRAEHRPKHERQERPGVSRRARERSRSTKDDASAAEPVVWASMRKEVAFTCEHFGVPIPSMDRETLYRVLEKLRSLSTLSRENVTRVLSESGRA